MIDNPWNCVYSDRWKPLSVQSNSCAMHTVHVEHMQFLLSDICRTLRSLDRVGRFTLFGYTCMLLKEVLVAQLT